MTRPPTVTSSRVSGFMPGAQQQLPRDGGVLNMGTDTGRWTRTKPPFEEISPFPVVTSIDEAALVTGHPESELWEDPATPRHVWWAPGGAESGHPRTCVAVYMGYREACPWLYTKEGA